MPIDLTSILKEWGVTLGLLSVVATTLTILFILSFREFSVWFLRLGKMSKSQGEIKIQLDRIESALAQFTAQKTVVSKPTEPKADMSDKINPTPQFQFGDGPIAPEHKTDRKIFELNS